MAAPQSWLVSATLVLLLGGCAQVVPYAPRTNLIEEIGLEATEQQLFATFGQNRLPRALPPTVDAMFMSQFSRVRIYASGVLDYLTIAGRRIPSLRVRLSSVYQCQQYADALMSLQHYVQSPTTRDTWPAEQAPAAPEPEVGGGACDACSVTFVADEEFCGNCGIRRP